MDNTFFRQYRVNGQTELTVPHGNWQVTGTELRVSDGFRVVIFDLVRVDESPVKQMLATEPAPVDDEPVLA